MKYSWNSTRKIKMKFHGLFGTRNYPLNSQKCEKLLFLRYFGGLGTNMKFHDFLSFYEFLKVSAYIFWIKTVSTSNCFFFQLFWIYFMGYHHKNILCSDYHSAWWYWCKKVLEKSSINFICINFFKRFLLRIHGSKLL